MSTPLTIRIASSKTEGVLQASKWLKVQVLPDPEEMEALFAMLGPVYPVVVSEPVMPGDAVLPIRSFLDRYAEYVRLLTQGQIPAAGDFRRFFSCALSQTLDTFYAIPAGNDRVLIRPNRPVIQLQAHHFFLF